ncbi:hypothetical protein BGZ49_009659 [Haplosporangium sp. Z 27]|nr:hypothetical protein BGZ49_009659 [Haplosporangium sp. Z 27]
MRLIKQNMDDQAAAEAMRGGAIGALKYCSVALFAGGVLQATSPRFAAIRPPQKAWLMVAAFLAGFGNGSDTSFTNFERRGREMQIRAAEKRRHDILYGTEEEHQSATSPSSSLASSSSSSQSEESQGSSDLPPKGPPEEAAVTAPASL